jgi:hypothetical protein
VRDISILILGLSLAATYIAPGTALRAAQTKSPVTSASAVVLTNVGMGEMQDDKEGITLGFTSYKASEGPGLIAMDHEFESSGKAHDYFEKKLSKAANVVDRKDNLNRAGKVVGERAQIQLLPENKETESAVLWTDGKMFREIFSSTPKNISELEKLYRR